MWHSYIFRKCCKFWHHTPLSCQKRCSKIQKIWHRNEAPYGQQISSHMWEHHFTEILLQLYEDELLHALPCAAPPSYTEYRSDAQVKVTGNGNKTLCPYLITHACSGTEYYQWPGIFFSSVQFVQSRGIEGRVNNNDARVNLHSCQTSQSWPTVLVQKAFWVLILWKYLFCQ